MAEIEYVSPEEQARREPVLTRLKVIELQLTPDAIIRVMLDRMEQLERTVYGDKQP